MKKIEKNLKTCDICGKHARMGNNRPHSLHRTIRIILPNIQKVNGQMICTRCLKTMAKK